MLQLCAIGKAGHEVHYPPVRRLSVRLRLVSRARIESEGVEYANGSSTRFCSLDGIYWVRRFFRGLTGAYANASLVGKKGLRRQSPPIPEPVALHCSMF